MLARSLGGLNRLGVVRDQMAADCLYRRSSRQGHRDVEFVPNNLDCLGCKIARNNDPLRGIFASNSDPS